MLSETFPVVEFPTRRVTVNLTMSVVLQNYNEVQRLERTCADLTKLVETVAAEDAFRLTYQTD